ncbi:MAG: RNA polymerase sigma factor WhiG [Actinobacteria bacterium]|nr:RNA polymerase sigma factor WhiG [Actinomycetota bacterium]
MRVESSSDIEALWHAFKDKGCVGSREKLILNYSPLVKYVAGRVSSGLPNSVDIGDLISYGIFGLIDAIEKFDPQRGIKFETYAIARIKGAIIDELRAMDWVPRSLRAKAKELENAYFVLENTLQRAPNDSEVAEKLGISVKELHLIFTKLSYTSVVYFEEFWANPGRDDSGDAAGSIADISAEDPVAVFESTEVREILTDAIERLPERERVVIALYYYEGLTLKEIGQVLGVTESRISQLHTRAVLRLRSKLHHASGLI